MRRAPLNLLAAMGIVAAHLVCGLAAQPDNSGVQKHADDQPKKSRRIETLTIPEVARDQVICFCLYTTHRGALKLTAVLYPLRVGEERKVTLAVERDGQWNTVAEAQVNPQGWTATFRVERWDDSRPAKYRVTHGGGASYEGSVRRNPRDKNEIVVASLSCNSNTDRGPRADIIANLKTQDPDLLFFAGDQSYDHRQHTAAFLLFGRQFGEIIRDRPTITIPDDHDVGHPNLWGEAGGVSNRPAGDDGGYIMPPAYVNMVQRAQTAHLPDPYDSTPVGQGITVYYTSLNVGGIDFAIIEDRKWKTGPFGLVPQMGPRSDHINDPKYDRAAIDVPEAKLLGERQLKFLREWGENWQNAEMKVVLSQTIFGGGANLHGGKANRLLADLDSNGWPQSGRAAALREIRRSYSFMMGVDQHLATVIHHGINDWEDSGYSFCSPSIVNFYPRWWWPLDDPLNHNPNNQLTWTGRYLDGFGNKLTMLAYANPTDDNHQAAGYGLVRFNKGKREITVECWPRHVDVTKTQAKQFPGWPVTINHEDNYGRRAVAWLPRLKMQSDDQVVQIVDEGSGDTVYTLRINGREFRPKVFKEGTYAVRVGERDDRRELKAIRTIHADSTDTLIVDR
jgi:hypothetical protein